jgi:hypothetical protein
MGFLPIFYAGAFFFIAFCGYVCISVALGFDALGKRFLVAVLAFGACSYVGFIAVILALSASPLTSILGGRTQPLIFTLAYLVPGLGGSWLSLKVLKALKLPKPKN